MIFVFKSDGCPACHQIHRDITQGPYKDWASHVTFVDIIYSQEEQCNKGYIEGEPTEGKCPIEVTPAMYIKKEDRLIYGYESIKDILANGRKQYRT